MGPRQCEICKEAVAKYKCKQCFLPYCCIACFKIHRQTPCKTLISSSSVSKDRDQAQAQAQAQPVREFEVQEEHPWRLDSPLLRAVAASGEIRQLVRDPKLQSLIINIDSAVDAESELQKAMLSPDFHDFASKILAIVNRQHCATSASTSTSTWTSTSSASF